MNKDNAMNKFSKFLDELVKSVKQEGKQEFAQNDQMRQKLSEMIDMSKDASYWLFLSVDDGEIQYGDMQTVTYEQFKTETAQKFQKEFDEKSEKIAQLEKELNDQKESFGKEKTDLEAKLASQKDEYEKQIEVLGKDSGGEAPNPDKQTKKIAMSKDIQEMSKLEIAKKYMK